MHRRVRMDLPKSLHKLFFIRFTHTHTHTHTYISQQTKVDNLFECAYFHTQTFEVGIRAGWSRFALPSLSIVDHCPQRHCLLPAIIVGTAVLPHTYFRWYLDLGRLFQHVPNPKVSKLETSTRALTCHFSTHASHALVSNHRNFDTTLGFWSPAPLAIFQPSDSRFGAV